MRLIFVVLPLLLAGCQSGGMNMRSGGAGAPAGTAKVTDSVAARELQRLNASANTSTNSTNSGVLRLVAGARSGDVGVADDAKFGGRVSVQVTRDYTAASGRQCRQFIVRRLATSAEPSHYAACLDKDMWFFVEP